MSRCQRFDFKRISEEDMAKALAEYAKGENIDITDEAIRYIAEMSSGAMRDAVSLLDQCGTYYLNEGITPAKVRDLLGAVDPARLFEFTDALMRYDGSAAMDLIQRTLMDGKDIPQLVADLLGHFRNLMVAAVTDKPTAALDYAADLVQRYREQGGAIPTYRLLAFVNAFSQLQSQLRSASNPRILVEVTTLRLCSRVGDSSADGLAERVNELEERLKELEEHGVAANIPAPVQAQPAATKPDVDPSVPKEVAKAVPDDIQNVIRNWKRFANSFEASLKAILMKSQPGYLEGDRLEIVCNGSAEKVLSEEKHQAEIEERLQEQFHRTFEIAIISSEEYDAAHKKKFGEVDKFEEIKNAINFDKIEDME
jgi:DNA polymerase-3 subunit gamma/tau